MRTKPIACFVVAASEYDAQCAAFDPGFVSDQGPEDAPVFPRNEDFEGKRTYRVTIKAEPVNPKRRHVKK